MSKKRYKQMTKEEFVEVAERSWVPVQLVGDAKPNWMRGIPDDKLELVLISGSFIDPRIIEANGITYSGVVGGMDLYRYDEKDVDIGFPFNKDHYVIFHNPENDDALLVAGPIKKPEDHWFSQLPNIGPEIKILEINDTEIDENED